MYFEIYKNPRSGQYWFVMKSQGNHKILVTSEMYEQKLSALHTIQLIASSAAAARWYDQTGEA